ncbi:MAG: hypothetical protein U0414_18745 [Polyangiaceae bacterium]
MKRRALVGLASVLWTVGCGSIVDRETSGKGSTGNEGGGTATTSSNGSIVETSGTSSSSAGGAGGAPADPGACIEGWRAVGPVDVPLGESSYRVDSAVAAGAGTLVGYTSFVDGAGTVAWKVRAFDGGLAPLGPASTIEQTFVSGALGPLSLVTSPDGVGALYWMDEGSRVAGLTNSGTLYAAPFEVPTHAAGMLDALGSDALSFVGFGTGSDPFSAELWRASPAGLEKAGPIDIHGFAVGRTNFNDGTFMAVWANDTVECADCALHLVARVFGADGAPISDVVPVVTDPSYGFISPGPRIVSAPLADGVAIAAATSLGIEVHWLDPNGVPSPTPVLLPKAKVHSVGISRVANGLLLVSWIAGSESRLEAALVAIVGPSPVIATWDFGGGYDAAPIIAQRQDGAVVFATSYDAGAAKEVLRAVTVSLCSP